MKTYGKHRFPGRLFVVEGIDGSGKSTQLALLQKWLESEGYGTFFSEWNSSALVRDVTRRGKKKRMLTPMTFSLIHATDFADRTEQHIIPPLMDRNLNRDLEESFRLFQGAVIDEYDRMVHECGLVVIDASRSIEEQQVQMRAIVTKALTGAKKDRIRRWVDLNSTARGSRP